MVNKICLNDIESFNNLGLQVNGNFTKLFNLENILNSEFDFVFGYYIEDKLVGFIHLNKMYENVDIINIVVDKDYRKQGIGNSLINYAINCFNDVNTIMLEVNENNIPAINLYLVNKFEVINKRIKYYGNDNALIMKRDV